MKLTAGEGEELMDPLALAAEIDARLKSLPPEAVTEDYRAVRREYSKALKKAPPRYVVELGQTLATDYSHRSTGHELIFHHKGALLSLTPAEVEEMAGELGSWWSVDCFGAYISGPAWRLGVIDDEVIRRWTASPDRWWRRAALVSTVYLHRAVPGAPKDAARISRDVARTLEACRTLAADGDDMVVKAMSWALRELSRYEREAVEGFLSEHDAVLAARVKREVRHKLLTGLKNPRRPR
jgi:3-methyladenine DNA glycosylase AlkD